MYERCKQKTCKLISLIVALQNLLHVFLLSVRAGWYLPKDVFVCYFSLILDHRFHYFVLKGIELCVYVLNWVYQLISLVKKAETMLGTDSNLDYTSFTVTVQAAISTCIFSSLFLIYYSSS